MPLRYTPATAKISCSPANVRTMGFLVIPGAAISVVNGCHKQDYAVLIVVGPPTQWLHAGRDRLPSDPADTRTLLLHRAAGAPRGMTTICRL